METVKLLVSAIIMINCAQAFTLNNNIAATFKESEVIVNVESSGVGGNCTNIGLTDSELLDLVHEAADRFWNKVSTSRLRIRRGNLVNTSGSFRTERLCDAPTSYAAGNCIPNTNLTVPSQVLISCNIESANFGTGVLAAAIPNNISGEDIVGSLILINDDGANQFVNRSRDEQVSIIAHEIGHAVGLGHSEFNSNLMYFESLSSHFRLGQDDVDGVTWLYPQSQPFSCGTISLEQSTKNFWGTFLFSFLFILLIFKFGKEKFFNRFN